MSVFFHEIIEAEEGLPEFKLPEWFNDLLDFMNKAMTLPEGVDRKRKLTF